MSTSSPDRHPIRIVVVDDQAIVRRGLRMILESQSDMEVIGEASDGVGAISLVENLDPDVVLMDIRMPNMDGIAATRALRAAGVRARILVLTTYASDENIADALRAGAVGFLAKTDEPEHILGAVRSVVEGGVKLGPDAMNRVLDRFLSISVPSAKPAPDLSQLTNREKEVLLLLGQGRSNLEIGAELFIGEATVKTHVARVTSKLGLRDRIQAVVFCYEHDLHSSEN